MDTGRNPADRHERGTTHHLVTDGRGTPPGCLVSGADVADLCRLLPLVLCVPLGIGPPTAWPPELLADRNYDSELHRVLLRRLGIEADIGRRVGEDTPRRRERYVVERTIAAVHQNRRLKLRYDERSDIHHALLTLACIKVCWYRLDPDRR